MNKTKLIHEKLTRYLTLKDEIRRLERELDALKKDHIDPFADSLLGEFSDNKYILGQALITRKLNPPKLQSTTGKDISKTQREQLCKTIPMTYVASTPMISEMLENLPNDKQLAHAIQCQGIQIVQNSRYDITRL